MIPLAGVLACISGALARRGAPFALVGGLAVSVRAPARRQDDVDLTALLTVAQPDDLAVARRHAQLVMERGYARGRDLVADLEALRAAPD